ncbi:uncharacterized protein LOC143017638 isoform X3 [Oratosquilla oratoria]|uniref:uncharacterized protein LOC143017638 isoform X3 n=1 Tax=Oratosquilla oratoria TaxID=337810 RepID=UPI003F7669E4
MGSAREAKIKLSPNPAGDNHSRWQCSLRGQDKAWAPHMVFKSCTDYISASVDQRQKGLSEICISHGLEGAVKPCH